MRRASSWCRPAISWSSAARLVGSITRVRWCGSSASSAGRVWAAATRRRPKRVGREARRQRRQQAGQDDLDAAAGLAGDQQMAGLGRPSASTSASPGGSPGQPAPAGRDDADGDEAGGGVWRGRRRHDRAGQRQQRVALGRRRDGGGGADGGGQVGRSAPGAPGRPAGRRAGRRALGGHPCRQDAQGGDTGRRETGQEMAGDRCPVGATKAFSADCGWHRGSRASKRPDVRAERAGAPAAATTAAGTADDGSGGGVGRR